MRITCHNIRFIAVSRSPLFRLYTLTSFPLHHIYYLWCSYSASLLSGKGFFIALAAWSEGRFRKTIECITDMGDQ